MEVGKNQNPLTFLATLGTNNKHLAIGRIVFQNLANLGQFFHGKSFLYVEIIIFKYGFGENSLVKETLIGGIHFRWFNYNCTLDYIHWLFCDCNSFPKTS
jgi:hypothetical protein